LFFGLQVLKVSLLLLIVYIFDHSRSHLWIQTIAVVNSQKVTEIQLKQDNIDLGEAEAIILSLELKADLLLMDERRGRAVATSYGLNVTGLLGVAQRAGAALQLLIIDEGFGTQDAEGCDRLIAAINAIASDFACILTVTHMPHLKEAFQARIEVNKTNLGSQLHLSM
jgi:hypothetical protein